MNLYIFFAILGQIVLLVGVYKFGRSRARVVTQYKYSKPKIYHYVFNVDKSKKIVKKAKKK